MLVTCPECGAKISSEADSCPSCAFAPAGALSKECNEDLVNTLNVWIGSTVKRYLTVCRCREDAYPEQLYPKLISARLVEDKPGYRAIAVLQCQKCKKTEENLGVTVVGQIIKFG